jgi:hypothetical protein
MRLFKGFKQTDFQVWFLKKDNDRYIILEKKRLMQDENRNGTISYKDKTFIIPQQSCLEDTKNHIIFFDYDKERIVAFHEIKLGYDAKLLDQLLVKQIIAQLVTSIRKSLQEKPSLGKMATYILCIALGGFIGWVVNDQYKASQFILGLIQLWL